MNSISVATPSEFSDVRTTLPPQARHIPNTEDTSETSFNETNEKARTNSTQITTQVLQPNKKAALNRTNISSTQASQLEPLPNIPQSITNAFIPKRPNKTKSSLSQKPNLRDAITNNFTNPLIIPVPNQIPAEAVPTTQPPHVTKGPIPFSSPIENNESIFLTTETSGHQLDETPAINLNIDNIFHTNSTEFQTTEDDLTELLIVNPDQTNTIQNLETQRNPNTRPETDSNANIIHEHQTTIQKYKRINLPRDNKFSALQEALDTAFPDGIAGLEFPFTMFAPTNLAFDKLDNDTLTDLLADKDALADVLLRHIVSGRDFQVPVGFSRLESVGGENIDVKRYINDIFSENVQISTSHGPARIVGFNILTRDGVVHAVDSLSI